MRFSKNTLGLAFAAVATLGFTTQAVARDTIQIAGSSTVLPFASIVAEEFGNTFSQFKTPVVGSGGTGGGLKQFSQGVGFNTIDIANASRPIKPAEVEAAVKAGVKKIQEVKFGYDGIVFASRAKGPEFKLTDTQIYQAYAAQVPVGGKLVANPYTKWSQIDKSLPNQDILLAVPASNHGTREVFDERVIHAGSEKFPEVKALDKDALKKALAPRADSRVVEISGDYTETLARLQAQSNAVGVFGLSFYDQNRDKLRVAPINGVVPSQESIVSGKYPVSRPLYFYVKGDHIGVVPGIKEYVEFFLNARISGPRGPLDEAGLIPLTKEERAKVVADFRAGKTVN